MWRKFRIVVLLFILATVAHRTWLLNSHTEWKKTLYVNVYPINMDGSQVSDRYIASLQPDQFEEIAEYYSGQSAQFNLAVKTPFAIRIGPRVQQQPPQPEKAASMLQTIVWSLEFRWWAWRNSPSTTVQPDIKLYLLYFDPANHPVLPHSTALSKGRVGLVNVFAERSYTRQNNVIIAHELLHTVGATDKYDLFSNQPAYPAGFAEPAKTPLYPQIVAELMAGRRPVSENKAEIPLNLDQTVIGSMTAREIGWMTDKKKAD